MLLGPDPRPVVTVLSGHEEVAQGAEVVPLGKAGRGVVPLDGPDGGGRCKKAVHPVGLDDSEKLAGIRCPYEGKFHGLDRVPFFDSSIFRPFRSGRLKVKMVPKKKKVVVTSLHVWQCWMFSV